MFVCDPHRVTVNKFVSGQLLITGKLATIPLYYIIIFTLVILYILKDWTYEYLITDGEIVRNKFQSRWIRMNSKLTMRAF